MHVSQMNVYECLCECNRKNQSYSPNTHSSRYVVVLENDVSDWIPLHCNSHWVQPKPKAIQTLKTSMSDILPLNPPLVELSDIIKIAGNRFSFRCLRETSAAENPFDKHSHSDS